MTHLLQEGTPPIHRGLNTQIFEPMEVVLIQTRIPPPLCCLLSFLISYLKKKKKVCFTDVAVAFCVVSEHFGTASDDHAFARVGSEISMAGLLGRLRLLLAVYFQHESEKL